MVSDQEKSFNRWIGRVLLLLALFFLAVAYYGVESLNARVERIEQHLGISGSASPRR